MKQQIIDLWKLSFGDTDEFIQLYFDRVYKEENTFVIKKGGKVVSALQILPYEMTYCGTTIPVGYICGVCTEPSERGKGLMNQLMVQALEEMSNRNYALAILIPASARLFDFYRRFEFANAFDYAIEDVYREIPENRGYLKSTQMLRLRSAQVTQNRQIDADNKYIYAYYNLKQCERDCCVLHSAYQFETVRQDWMLGKGEIWVAFENEQPVGLAFLILRTPETVTIREIMYDRADIKYQLVQSILNHYQLPKAEIRTLPSPPNSIPYAMARMIDNERMIELYRSFHSCFQVPDVKNIENKYLTQLLLQYEQRKAWMNLMLD